MSDADRPAGYFSAARPEVCELVSGRGLRILDIGCGAGEVGAYLKRRGIAATVHGIEGDATSAARAALKLDRVFLHRIAGSELPKLEPPYDVVVLADVLEHLSTPEDLVANAHELLLPGGQLIVSIPNIRSLRVVGPLVVFGRFEYGPSGILDRGHLRFFTRSSLTTLLADAGFGAIKVTRAPLGLPRRLRAFGPVAQLVLGDLATSQLLARAIRSR